MDFTDYNLSDSISENLIIVAGVINEDDVVYPVGSGVIIAPHLALTAKHVVEELWKSIYGTPLAEFRKKHTISFSMLVYQILPHSHTNQSWNVIRFWDCPGTDIVLLELTTPQGEKRNYTDWPKLTLNALPPLPNEHITAFGFTKLSRHKEIINCSAKKADGKVVEVYGEKRERGFNNFPCFSVDTIFDHGMSGGPILDEKGHLRGLISNASVDGIPSYGSSLWPIAVTKTHDIENQYYSKDVFPFFLDLAKSKLLDSLNWELISIHEDNGIRSTRILDPNISLQCNSIGLD